MKLKKEVLAAVVTEASSRMSDPSYSATVVGEFVELQVAAVQFITAHEAELGGAEGIISVVFHCALVAQAVARGEGAPVRELSYEDLDAVAKGDLLAKLERAQPPIHEFVTSNLENEVARHLVAHVALALTA